MNHPTLQELIEFLDDELTSERQNEVAAHVEACNQCNSQTTTWRTARTALASWALPIQSDPATYLLQKTASRRRWRTAAAGATLVAAGFGLAVLLTPVWASSRSDVEIAREVRRHVQDQLHAELATLATSQQSAHEELLTAMNGRLDQLELQWLVDYAQLRRDIETVAIGAEEGLRRLASAEANRKQAP